MRYAPHPPSPAHARLARCLAPLLALLLVAGNLLPAAPVTNAIAARPSFVAPQKLPTASVAIAAAAPLDPPSFTSSWLSSEGDNTWDVAWGDYDGDGDLDLAVGNDGQPTRLYRNDAGVLTASAVWSSSESDRTRSVAWGDYDGDGDLDLALGNA
ncbi:MAG TPA: FG-GAP-like repeat-containing protein, partial [Roseiflexaceae bacterium]